MAVEKLTNAPYSAISTVEPKPAAVLAVLDQRLHVTYNLRYPSTHMIEDAQVSKHMRLVCTAPQSGDFYYLGYTLEPLLAEAGAHALSIWCEKYGRIAIETLAYGIEGVPNAGELVGTSGGSPIAFGRQVFLDGFPRQIWALTPLLLVRSRHLASRSMLLCTSGCFQSLFAL